MSAQRTCLLLVLTGWVLGISPPLASGGQPGTDSAFARVERLRKISETIPGEMIRARVIFDEALAEGVRTGTWSEAERTERRKRVDAALSNMLPARMNWPGDDLRAVDVDPGLENSPTFAITDWLHRRLRYLHDLRERIRYRQIEATLEYAELKWLEARTKAELAPAIKALEDVRVFKTIADSGRREGRLVAENLMQIFATSYLPVYDFLTVLDSRDPFFLPDPDPDPEAFAQGCALWADLESIKHSFVLRPAVREEFARRRDRFYRPANRLFAELDASILAEAGSKRLGEQVQKIIPYTARAPVLHYHPDRSLLDPRPDLSPIDFRDLPRQPLYMSLQDKDPNLDPKNPAVSYRAWVEMLQAEESGDLNLARQKWDQNRESFGFLAEPVSSYMLTRYAQNEPRRQIGQAPFDLTPTAQEIATGSFLDVLRRVASSSKQGRQTSMPDLDNVIRAWEIWNKPDPSTPLPDLARAPWSVLATLRGGAAFLAFRDRTVREEIARIAGGPIEPQSGFLHVTMRDQLGKCIALEQFDSAKKMLRIAAISGAIESGEIARYSHALDIFSQAHAMAEASPQGAQNILRAALRDMPDPTLGDIAARKILEWQNPSRKNP